MKLKHSPASILFTVFSIVILTGLYLTSLINYLLFHTLAELYSIVIAYSVFVITWNSRQYIKNKFLIIIGIAYLFIAIIDTLHTITFTGMNILTDYDYYATKLWIGARYFESITLLTAILVYTRIKEVKVVYVFSFYFLITSALVYSVFISKTFPACFVYGTGLTMFKIVSEYIIISILLAAILVLYKRKKDFDESVFKLILWSLIFTIVSELAFTFYIDVYGFSNLVGHYFKIFSFYLIYRAIIQTGIIKPHQIIFREIDSLNEKLLEEIEAGKKSALEREKLVADLKTAFANVKKLSGLLPICSSCKKIRDDKGYWKQIESFISEHSEAGFTHGICPDCIDMLYPDNDDNDLKK